MRLCLVSKLCLVWGLAMGTPRRAQGCPFPPLGGSPSLACPGQACPGLAWDPLGSPRGPLGSLRKPLGSPRNPKEPQGVPKEPLGIPKGPLGVPKGPLGSPRGSLGSLRAPLGSPRGRLGSPRPARAPVWPWGPVYFAFRGPKGPGPGYPGDLPLQSCGHRWVCIEKHWPEMVTLAPGAPSPGRPLGLHGKTLARNGP